MYAIDKEAPRYTTLFFSDCTLTGYGEASGYRINAEIPVIGRLYRLSSDMSFYNAAEGNWTRETAAREACRAEWLQALKEAQQSGLQYDLRGYLI